MILYNISVSFTAIFSLVLGVFVLVKDPRNRANKTWGMGCITCGFWAVFFLLMINARDISSAILFAKICNIVAAYMCVLIAHFCKEITGANSRITIIRVGYASALLITLFGLTSQFCSARPFLAFNYYVSAKPLYNYFTAHFFFYLFYAEYLLVKGLSSLPATEKNKIKYILIGLTAGYVGGISSFLPVYNLPIEPCVVVFVLGFWGFFNY
jgi:hypothetical protein